MSPSCSPHAGRAKQWGIPVWAERRGILAACGGSALEGPPEDCTSYAFPPARARLPVEPKDSQRVLRTGRQEPSARPGVVVTRNSRQYPRMDQDDIQPSGSVAEMLDSTGKREPDHLLMTTGLIPIDSLTDVEISPRMPTSGFIHFRTNNTAPKYAREVVRSLRISQIH